jgi:hypothetical protein
MVLSLFLCVPRDSQSSVIHVMYVCACVSLSLCVCVYSDSDYESRFFVSLGMNLRIRQTACFRSTISLTRLNLCFEISGYYAIYTILGVWSFVDLSHELAFQFPS